MKLIVISNSTSLEDEAQTVTKLFESGLETFHLRKLKISTREMKEFINEIPKHFHNRILIHSHHNLARKFNLKGIHITQAHKKKKVKTWLSVRLIQLRHPSIEITTSFSNIGYLFEDDHRFNYDYVFLKPIFSSVTSKFQGGFTEHSLRSAIQKTPLNVIAYGGVDINAIEKAYKIGFRGVAFYSSIWKQKDPVAEFNRIVERFEELKIPIE